MAKRQSSQIGLGPKPCATCGRQFQPYRDFQVTCSKACRLASYLPCNTEGCERPSQGRGMCNTHYQRWLRGDRRASGNMRPYNPGATCKAPDCESTSKAKGYCGSHYMLWR